MARRLSAIVIATVCGLAAHSDFLGDARADEPACAAGSLIALGPSSSVCGVAAGRPGVIAYKGIAYASAGRWRAPQPTQWPPAGAKEATGFGPICPQDDAPEPIAEDCLYLNVWAPESARSARARSAATSASWTSRRRWPGFSATSRHSVAIPSG